MSLIAWVKQLACRAFDHGERFDELRVTPDTFVALLAEAGHSVPLPSEADRFTIMGPRGPINIIPELAAAPPLVPIYAGSFPEPEPEQDLLQRAAVRFFQGRAAGIEQALAELAYLRESYYGVTRYALDVLRGRLEALLGNIPAEE